MALQTLNDKGFRFLGLPLVALMGHLIFFNRNNTGDEIFGFWGIYFLSLAETVLIWETNRLVFQFFRYKYPALHQTRRRILAILLVSTLLTIIVRTLNVFLYDATRFWGYRFPLEAYLYNIFVALLFVVVVGGTYEAVYYFRMWKNTAVESEGLKRENLQTQLHALKAKINPHFLFNSLGSLSSLIEEDAKRAQAFVGEMATVYRYLLQANEKDLVSLAEEMHFIKAYSNLLRTRFEEGLQLVADIREKEAELLLPPLTIQILLENAVKHNAILASRPLLVRIYTDDAENLVVVNNLQRKTSPVYSSKTGLNNIMVKYRLLNQPEVLVTQTDTHFQVSVPLIKTNVYAGFDR